VVVRGTVGKVRQGLILYYSARFFAQVAQNLLFASLFVAAGTSDNAAIGLSSLLVATTAASLLFGVVGGALADRIGPGRGMALGAILRTAVIVLCCLQFDALVLAAAVIFAYSAVSQVYSPSEMAMVRVLCGKGRGAGHSLGIALQYAGQGVGMLALAPLLFVTGGTQAMLAGAAVAGLVLSAITIALSFNHGRPAREPAGDHSSIRDSLRVFKRSAMARDALAVLAVQTMIVQGIVVALPLYIRNDISLGEEWGIFLLAPGAAGVIAGLAWSAAAVTPEVSQKVMRLALVSMVAGVLALASLDYGLEAVLTLSQVGPLVDLEASLNTTFMVAFPVAFLVGLAVTLALVSARVALTAAAPVAHQSRVFAVQATLTDSFVVLPLLLMGIGVEVAGARPVLAAMGLIGAATFVFIQLPRFMPIPLPLHPHPHKPALVPVPVETD
jgi:MFS family permease